MSDSYSTREFEEGDIIYSEEGGLYYPAKIIKIETLADGSIAWHQILYKSQEDLPTVEQVPQLEIFMVHTSMLASPDGVEFLINTPVYEHELVGYEEYLEEQRQQKEQDETSL